MSAHREASTNGRKENESASLSGCIVAEVRCGENKEMSRSYEYRGRQLAVTDRSTDEHAHLWRKDKAEMNDKIKWERMPSKTLKIWGYLDSSPRYLIEEIKDNLVQVTYWPYRVLDGFDKLGKFKTVEDAKKAATDHHKHRKRQ